MKRTAAIALFVAVAALVGGVRAADPAAPAPLSPADPAASPPRPTTTTATTTTATTTTATAPPSSPCCDALTAAGFTRSPGVPVVIVTTSKPGEPTRDKQDGTLCTCGAGEVGVPGADGGPIADWAGPVRVKERGGTNTQRYNAVRQFAAYLPKPEKGGGGAAGSNGTGTPPPPALPLLLGLDGDHIVFLGQVNDTGGIKESMGRDLARAMGAAGAGAGAGAAAAPLSSPYATWATPPGPLGWVPRTVHVELFLVTDGAPPGSRPDHYRGLYLASEHISRGKYKLPLPKADPAADRVPAIATFLHGEPDPDGTPITGRVTTKEWMVKWPANDKLTPVQAGVLEADLNGFEAALFGGSGGGVGNGTATAAMTPVSDWRAWMDEGAFLDWFLHVAKKSYHSAAFMHKPDGVSPWRMGPIWAQLQGFGTCCGYNFRSQPSGYDGPGRSGGNGYSPNGWLFSICRERGRCTPLDGPDGKGYDFGNGLALWFGEAFFEDVAFAPAAAARWKQLRAGPWAPDAVAAMLAAKQSLIGGPPMARTLARWPAAQKPWLGDLPAQSAAAFDAVRDWTAARLAWLDGAFAQAADPATRDEAYPVSFKK